MTQAWLAPDKTGDRKPTVRATIQVIKARQFPYDTRDDLNRLGFFTSILFGQTATPIELPNIEELRWTRNVDQDTAEATLVLGNSEVVPIGGVNPTGGSEDFEQQGYLTPSRGTVYDVNPWGYDTRTAWSDLLIPDRLVRTYEGYGSDPDVYPGEDPNLVQSGTWLIDDVEFTHDGRITVQMRDVGRLLLDSIVFPGTLLPYYEYPMSWSRRRNVNRNVEVPTGGRWHIPSGAKPTSSNNYYVGKNIQTSDGSKYVGPKGVYNGDKPTHPLNKANNKWWTSTGQNKLDSKVWWQANLAIPQHVRAVRITTRGGPYRVFISVGDKNRWYGKRMVNFNDQALDTDPRITEGVNIFARVPWVASDYIARDRTTTIILPETFKNITRIRVTFSGLYPHLEGGDRWHRYRASMRRFQIYTGAASKLGVGTSVQPLPEGNYEEYSEIVRRVCAWCGLFWPPASSGANYIKLSPSTVKTVPMASQDQQLTTGRAWGSFMNTGTAGVADLTPDLFDKQPFMTVIRHVADMLGYMAYVDENGGFVFRLPNIWRPGNFVTADDNSERKHTFTNSFVTLSDEDTLLSYSTTLSSRNLREILFVANATGKPSSVVDGFMPDGNDISLRRMAGWSDMHFANQRETNVAADLISAKQKFSYRKSQLRIYGYPAIQIDDQVRIFERTTNETYFHYVSGISSTLNMRNGTWHYDLTTHWLGEQKAGSWVVDVGEDRPLLKRFLQLQGFA